MFSPTSTLKNYLLVVVIITFSIAVDQVTKSWARQNLKSAGTIEVVGDIFILTYAENDGAFLGLGSNLHQPYKTILLTIFPVLLTLGALGYLLVKHHDLTRGELISIASIVGGGGSNVWDRLVHAGSVTDFLNFGIGPWFRTGILNTADMSITFGAIALVLVHLRSKQP
ncbi:MAG: signal peptidase II [Lentisphaeria bacterium]|nr:signal peptidase II [Candidatus Neomarinimicrobiota bacterium]MCF7841461.1 signal peptidase II [Lentisphaeria bacterium]